MTDLEATRLCAEAMQYTVTVEQLRGRNTSPTVRTNGLIYDPLHDDAQAMALVKRFHLQVEFLQGLWAVSPEKQFDPEVMNESLNAAIVFCVAAMQRASANL